jgi:DNA-binding transcriptional ArsR family regulator
VSARNASAQAEASVRHHHDMTADRSSPAPGARTPGDADLAAVGAVLAEPARARILLALADGRALPASVLAAEAGVAPSTASEHLARLVDGGLLTVRPQGRHRYYALAGPHVGELIEAIARLAPSAPVRSLREGTRAHTLRQARTCYDHLAGRLGVAVFGALVEQGLVTGGNGRHVHAQAREDRLSGPGRDLHYRLTAAGQRRLSALGVALPPADAAGEVALRYCVDWTEQAHHLSGAVGRALTDRIFELGWVRRLPRTRGVRVTGAGVRGLQEHLALRLGDG